MEEGFASAVGAVVPALEIVDSRVRDWRISIVDTVADNASSGLFVLGDARVVPAEAEIVNCTMRMTANGTMVSAGRGGACLGSPYAAGQWLARQMIEMGRPLRAGDIVLSGALGPMVTVQPHTTYEARIEGIGSVSVSF